MKTILNKFVSFCLLSTSFLIYYSALAHHAFSAQYDADAPIHLTGVVVKVEWLNPHAYFYIDVEDPSTHAVTTWACELGSPVTMQRQGWTRESLVLGETVLIDGFKARDGSKSLNASSVVIESTGQKLFSQQARQPNTSK
jgi:Family of unknown function (DUF6152)